MDLSTLPVAWANYLSILGFLVLGTLVWLIPRKIIFTEALTNHAGVICVCGLRS